MLATNPITFKVVAISFSSFGFLIDKPIIASVKPAIGIRNAEQILIIPSVFAPAISPPVC